jgi:hypothetical protein
MGRAQLVTAGRSLRARVRARRYSPAMFRTGLACAVVAAACIVEFGSNSGADTSFIPGNATAQAQAISLAPTTGGLNYAITLATSISDYQDSEAQSLSETIDLGAIGTALEAAGCSGGAPVVPSKDVPPSVQAESVNGNQSLSDTITPASSPVGVGTENAVATTQPSSTSNTSVAAITVPGGLLTISGLTSSSHTSIDNGSTRTATATSDVGAISLAHGLVVLGGLQWTATQQTGATTTSSGTFSIGSLTVGGVPVNLAQLTQSLNPQTVLTVVNTALSPVGLNIEWPAETTLQDGTVQISPLIVGIDNNTLGQEVIGANLGSVQTEREAVVNALLSANCNLADAILVGDIGIGVMAGGGNLNIDLGGASAETNDLAEQSPFGSGATLSSTSSATTGNTGSGATTGNSGTPGTPAVAGNSGTAPLPSSGTTTAPAPAAGSGPARESLGPLEKSSDCVSLGPAGGGCITGNVAVPIGLAALALVVGLFTWDYVRQRRRGRMAGGAEVVSP